MYLFVKKLQSYLMRSTLLLPFLLIPFCKLYAQADLLESANSKRLHINSSAMWVLGSWAVGNIASGAILRNNTSGSRRYFHEMNMIWNVVNLGLAGAGLYGSYTTDPSTLGLWETLQEQQKIEKILLFNAALDLGYMATGAYLIERAKNTTKKPERLKGYGQALILQGAFLLLFDSGVYTIQHTQTQPLLKELIGGIAVSPNSIGITIPL